MKIPIFTRKLYGLITSIDNQNADNQRSLRKMLGVIEKLEQREQMLARILTEAEHKDIYREVRQRLFLEHRVVGPLLKRAHRQYAQLIQTETVSRV